jgi:hypothetical protein
MTVINPITQRLRVAESLEILHARREEFRKHSDKYRYVSSRSIIDRVLNLADRRGVPTVGMRILYSDRPGIQSTKHLIEFKFHDLERDLFGTPVVPRLLVWNSFNTECSLSLSVGVHRKVCDNGLTLGKSMYSDRAIHLKGTRIEEVVEEFEHQVAAALDYIETSMSTNFVEMMGGQLNRWEISRILSKLVESGTISKRTEAEIQGTTGLCNFTGRAEDQDFNLWNLYNIVNETMRVNSRSAVAQEEKNSGLMDRVLEAAA